MKEIKITKTIEEITGYEANDGTYFKTKEECAKYEESAEAAIKAMFFGICVKYFDEPTFPDNAIYEMYGYGNEEYYHAIIDIKSEKELKIANMFSDMWAGKYGMKVPNDYIGKRILVDIGNEQYDNVFNIIGTEDEMVEGFKKTMARFFRPEDSEE